MLFFPSFLQAKTTQFQLLDSCLLAVWFAAHLGIGLPLGSLTSPFTRAALVYGILSLRSYWRWNTPFITVFNLYELYAKLNRKLWESLPIAWQFALCLASQVALIALCTEVLFHPVLGFVCTQLGAYALFASPLLPSHSFSFNSFHAVKPGVFQKAPFTSSASKPHTQHTPPSYTAAQSDTDTNSSTVSTPTRK